MRTEARRMRPLSLFVVTFVLLVEGAAALVGGIQMLRDPFGEPLGMPVEGLAGSPFVSYLVPGLLLTVVLGIYPLMAALLLWWRPSWPAMAWLERLTHRHWTCTVAATAGVGMLVWIAVQVALLGASHPLQAVIAGMGLVAVAFAFMPDTRRAYQPAPQPVRRR